jgi:hypothetical protein
MDADAQKRLEELEAKAAGPGLSADEANELGKLYADAAGAEYGNAQTAGNTEELADEEANQKILEMEAAKAQWKDMDQKRSRISFKEGAVTPERSAKQGP